MSERMGPSERARQFLDAITEGSPEQDSLLWYENAPPDVRKAAFIKVDSIHMERPDAAAALSAASDIPLDDAMLIVAAMENVGVRLVRMKHN